MGLGQKLGSAFVEIFGDSSKLEKSLKDIQKETDKATQKMEKMSKSNVKRGFDGINLSVNELKLRIVDLKDKMAKLSKASGVSIDSLKQIKSGKLKEEYQNISNEIQNVTNKMNQMKNVQDERLTPAQKRSNSANFTAIDVLQATDISYHSLTNSVQQTARQLSFLAQTTDKNTGKQLGMMGAFKQMGAGLMGVNGIMIAITLVMAGVGLLISSIKDKGERMSAMLKNIKTDTDKAKDALKTFRGELSGLSKTDFEKTFISLQSILSKIKDKLNALGGMVSSRTAIGATLSKILGITPQDLQDAKDAVDEAEKVRNSMIGRLQRQIKDQEDIRAQTADKKEYQKAVNEIAKLEKQILQLNKTSNDLLKDSLDLERAKFDANKITQTEYVNFLIKQKDLIRGSSQEELERLAFIEGRLKYFREKTAEEIKAEKAKIKTEQELLKIHNDKLLAIAQQIVLEQENRDLVKDTGTLGIDNAIVIINKLLAQAKGLETINALLKIRNNLEKQRGGEFGTLGSDMSLVKPIGAPDPNKGKTVEEIIKEGIAQRRLNNELSVTGTLANSVADGLSQAGRQLAYTLGQSVQIFSTANSLLQQFINNLAAAVVQMIALAAAQAALSFLNPFGLFAAEGGSFSGGKKLATGEAVKGGVGLAGGGIVPPGFPNDSFPVRVQSGELLKVYTPLQQNRNMQDYADLVNGINTVNNSVQALNMNLIKSNNKPLNVVIKTADPTATVKYYKGVENSLIRSGVDLNQYKR